MKNGIVPCDDRGRTVRRLPKGGGAQEVESILSHERDAGPQPETSGFHTVAQSFLDNSLSPHTITPPPPPSIM